MAYEFKLPDLGEGLTEGEVARWLVQEGQEIAEDDPLVEIQTDKTTVEIPSPAAGKVARILVAEGEVVPVGTVLVVIGEDGAAACPRRRSGARRDEARGLSPLLLRSLGGCGQPRSSARSPRSSASISTAVTGTGPNGQVTEADVRGQGSGGAQEGRREKLRGVRRLIAEHMARAHREVPPVTWVEECDFEELDLKLLVPAALKAARALAAGVPGAERAARGRRDRLPRPLRHRRCRPDRPGARRPGRARLRLAVPCRARRRGRAPRRRGPCRHARARGATRLDLHRHERRASSPACFTRRSSTTPRSRSWASAGSLRARSCGTAKSSSARPATIAITFDHRVIDGARASEFGLAVIRRLEARPG